MNIDQKKKILEKIVNLEHDIEEIKRCRHEIAVNGYASATMSSGSGSKSYTRQSLPALTEMLRQLNSEIKNLRAMLSNTSPALPSQIYTIYV